MTEIVLFHHVQGLTSGVQSWADRLRSAGHVVHTPDLFDGHTFDSIDAGFAYQKELGEQEQSRRLSDAVLSLPAELVYAGFSMGVMSAQELLQTRPGGLGGLFYHSFADPSWFGGAWPGVPAQVHAMDADPFFVGEGDLDAVRPFVSAHPEVDLFLYPGSGHLYLDDSLPDWDPEAAELALARSLTLLDGV